jgi:hypothetical protein
VSAGSQSFNGDTLSFRGVERVCPGCSSDYNPPTEEMIDGFNDSMIIDHTNFEIMIIVIVRDPLSPITIYTFCFFVILGAVFFSLIHILFCTLCTSSQTMLLPLKECLTFV